MKEQKQKKYDADGNLITDDNQTNSDTSTDTTNEETSTDTAEENVTTVEEPINAPELLTPENYLAVKEILIDRLDYLNIENYTLTLR